MNFRIQCDVKRAFKHPEKDPEVILDKCIALKLIQKYVKELSYEMSDLKQDLKELNIKLTELEQHHQSTTPISRNAARRARQKEQIRLQKEQMRDANIGNGKKSTFKDTRRKH